jgi:hypothetical protein
MTATATPAAAAPDTMPKPTPAERDTTPEPTPEETAKLVIGRLMGMVLYRRPRAAIAAFEALITLNKIHQETYARMIELSRSSRPALAAAAVKALVRARRAYRRYQDGRDHVL